MWILQQPSGCAGIGSAAGLDRLFSIQSFTNGLTGGFSSTARHCRRKPGARRTKLGESSLKKSPTTHSTAGLLASLFAEMTVVAVSRMMAPA
jgi:hypothetical protein